MGKLRQGLLGGVSGKVGPTVGSSWKGIAVIKALPLSVANPRTAGQVAQRTKMTNVVAFAQIILASIIKPLWDRFAQQASGYNEFVSANIALFAGSMPAPASSLIISRGKMAATPISLTDINPARTQVTIEWDDDSGEGLKLATDEAYIVVVNETDEVVAFSAAEKSRSDALATVTLPSAATDPADINCYLAFRRADGTVVSDTSFKIV